VQCDFPNNALENLNMTSMTAYSVPTTGVDPFDDAVLLDPYETYRTWRDAGPAVWSTRHKVWIISRFDDVKQALGDHKTYISGGGVGLYGPAIEALRGTVIASDPPEHGALRRVLAERMSLRGLKALQSEVQAAADDLVDSLVVQQTFDAVPSLAQKFPLQIVANLIGLPGRDHHRLLDWADCGFNTFGPQNDRTLRSMPRVAEMFEYIGTIDADPSTLRPGSMGREIYEAAERGEIRLDQCGRLMAAYLMAGLDTTIASIANAVWLFGLHPDQWDSVRSDPARIPQAFNEILRFESPVQGFRRTLSRDVNLGGISLRENDSVLLLYGSANRDERHWKDADRFDVRRPAIDHLALGSGIHNCAGQGLARLEAHALIGALARRVERFVVAEPSRHLNNVIRSIGSLPVTLIGAKD
jgi:cytochrome P450